MTAMLSGMPPAKRKAAAKRKADAAVSARGPRIRVLTRREATDVLARNHVGRVAFVTVDHRIELHPVHFVWSENAIYGRTSFGAKYAAWMHRPYVAFEVDELEKGPFDWRSVIVHGTVYVLTDSGTTSERDDHRRAMQAIRELLPQAFTARDPTPYRSVIFRIEPHEVTGRAATTK
jgi:nitroimidazol reductase NimA-like FMN-containing flavoprotein (pyridoxamine 5'-phosphate oxidase superfamily)